MTAGVKLGRAFFILVVVFLLGYALTRGIFLGSTTEYEASMGGFYFYNCRYLYPDGVRVKFGGGTGKTPNEAKESWGGVCPLLGSDR
jgi:hypothetical protein